MRVQWLPWAEYCYNTATHSSINISPFQALYGRTPPSLIQGSQGTTAVHELEEMVKERDVVLDELRVNLKRAQQRMKLYADC